MARCRTRWKTIVGEVCKAIPGDHVGIHAHNDTAQAVANSFAAVRAGARQIQGTLNGLGERCGNANLVSIIPTLKLKQEYAEKFEIGVSDDQLKNLVHVSHRLDELLNRASNRYAPYVGENAFATKAGIHASAIMKEPETYEHVRPDAVGNKRKVLVSDQAGRANVLAELDRIGLKVDRDDPRIGQLLDEVKRREAAGYAYEAADASFELLARRMFGKVPDFFDGQPVRRERGAAHQCARAARERVDGGGQGEGRRPDHDLGRRRQRPGQCARPGAAQGSRQISEIHCGVERCTDYRVRILNAGTEAVTRVLIESEDEHGERWSTIGVSPNIIDASFQALMDSIVYKLVRAGAQA